MRSGFTGFPVEGIQFMRGLARNNNRDWFQARKAVFDEHVKAPMAGLVDALIPTRSWRVAWRRCRASRG